MRLSRLTAVTTLFLAACTPVTPVSDIVQHPREYADKNVTVEGQVTNVFSVIVFKYFTLDDGTGSIPVITERPMPAMGEKIKVTGTVKEGFALGDQSLTILVEEPPSGR